MTSRWLWPAAAAAGLPLAGCAGATDPHSSQSAGIASLWWLMLAVAVAVGVLVLVFLGWALLRRRSDPGEQGIQRVVLGAAGVTVAILAVVFGFSLVTGTSATAPATDGLVVKVTGHQWWYEVDYPTLGVATRDELHLPAAADVTLELSSSDVIHSLWIPQLNGKVDMFPGRVTKLRLSAVDAGGFREACAEFCGIGHASMTMPVTVDTPADFAAWVAAKGGKPDGVGR